MADLNVERESQDPAYEGYTIAELIFWIVGIFCIPLVPILMIWFFTPWSGT
jgi:hypothetical protein